MIEGGDIKKKIPWPSTVVKGHVEGSAGIHLFSLTSQSATFLLNL
jgi:hypothetical protein